MITKNRTKPSIALAVSIALLLASTLAQIPVLASTQGQEQEPVGDQAPPLDAETPNPTPTPLSGPQPEGWTAGETSVSELSDEEKAALLGVPMEALEWEQEQVAQAPPRMSASYSYPSTVDWRDYEGRDFTTPIRAQGSGVLRGLWNHRSYRVPIGNRHE